MFEPDNPPTINAGITICYECGKIYWCTPIDDAYQKEDKNGLGRICEGCLVKPITGRKKADLEMQLTGGEIKPVKYH